MKVSITLANNTSISKEIAKALIPEFKKIMDKTASILKKEIPIILKKHIEKSPEYQSILSGQLKYEFGIPNPSEKLRGLILTWIDNTNVQFTPPSIDGRGMLKTSLSVSMVRIDLSDVLYTEYAAVYDRQRGYVLPWLQWLLLEGNKVIVKDHSVVMGPNQRSRTGQAIMRSKENKFWKVPAQYAGTQNDNWITRCIDSAGPDIETLLYRVLK